jgi:hypothetical protein
MKLGLMLATLQLSAALVRARRVRETAKVKIEKLLAKKA